ncbi:MAG: hypothetical protein WC822_07355 [Candidatus Paceibacterota bacterium]|jgi:hypothetical protein
MKIPEKLDIGGVTYRFRTDEQAFLNRQNLNGQTRFEELDICLSTTIHPEKRMHTFWHETLHAIDEEYCGSKAMTEDATDAIASGLLQVLKQLGVTLEE